MTFALLTSIERPRIIFAYFCTSEGISSTFAVMRWFGITSFSLSNQNKDIWVNIWPFPGMPCSADHIRRHGESQEAQRKSPTLLRMTSKADIRSLATNKSTLGSDVSYTSRTLPLESNFRPSRVVVVNSDIFPFRWLGVRGEKFFLKGQNLTAESMRVIGQLSAEWHNACQQIR